VLFIGLGFSIAPHKNFSADALCHKYIKLNYQNIVEIAHNISEKKIFFSIPLFEKKHYNCITVKGEFSLNVFVASINYLKSMFFTKMFE